MRIPLFRRPVAARVAFAVAAALWFAASGAPPASFAQRPQAQAQPASSAQAPQPQAQEQARAPRAAAAAAQEFARVPCADSSLTYALFLPSTYTPDRRWPILYCFDPARDGLRPLRLFERAAERLGFLIASTNDFDSSDSSPERIGAILAGVWNDTQSRLSIDPDRVYAAGFSGGGRICWSFDRVTPGIDFAGILETGAGLPADEQTDDLAPGFCFIGVEGRSDFNYYEMRALEQALSRSAVCHRMLYFDGGHQWPPEEDCAWALTWLALRSKRAGRPPIARDDSWIDDLLTTERERARRLLATDRPLEALASLRQTCDDFDGLRDVSDLRAQRDSLAGDRQVERRADRERGLARTASRRIREAIDVLEEVRRSPEGRPVPGAEDLCRRLECDSLLAQAASSDPEERLAAERVIQSIYVRAANVFPVRLLKEGRVDHAIPMLLAATFLRPERPVGWYNLGAALARQGDREAAMRALRRAVDLGFRDWERMQSDPDLESLRGSEAFEELLRNRSEAAPAPAPEESGSPEEERLSP
ncbi:MAG: hypothetical protein ACE15D_00225 [Candidatus Eisenbacteria bacterium]